MQPNAVNDIRCYKFPAEQVADPIDGMEAAEQTYVAIFAIKQRPDAARVLAADIFEFFSEGLEQAATAVAVAPACGWIEMLGDKIDSVIKLVVGPFAE